jgi:SulP family sulfate permease
MGARAVEAGVSESVSLHRRSTLRADLLASLAVVALEVPQAMAYAMLAGLPPVAGLVVSITAPFGYAAFVRDRYLSVGPVALICLLVAGGLQSLAPAGSERWIDLAAALALEVGALLMLLGLVRAGFVANFLGHPATIGFNGAAAILTAATQVGPLFGLPRGTASAENPWPALLHVGDAKALPLLFGAATIAIIVVLPRVTKRVPAPLVACALAIATTAALGLSSHGLATVGDVPASLPRPHLPDVSLADLRALLPTAISIAIVSYGGSIALAKALAAKERDRVDPDRVLSGLGASDVAAGLFGGFPVSASLSRSMLTIQAGGRTRWVAVFVAAWIVIVMFALGPVFGSLPLAVLAGIVIHGALGLFDVAEARAIWRARRVDALTMLFTFAATLAFGLVEGLATGLFVALALFVYRTANPHTAELGRIPGSLVYRNVNRFSVETCPQVGILRVDAPLYFANARFLEDRIHQMFAERPEMQILALDLSGVGDMDSTALQALRNVVLALRARGNDLHIVGPIGPVRDILARTGMDELLGASNIHREIVEAAPLWMARISRRYCEETCKVSAFPDCTMIPRIGTPSLESEAAKFSPQI